MQRLPGDLLDTVARVVARTDGVGSAGRHKANAGPANGQETAPDQSQERYSRASAMKLALVGGASLSLGLWRVSPARADELSNCLTGCVNEHNEKLQREITACHTTFRPRAFYAEGPWAQFKVMFRRGHLTFYKDVVAYALSAICVEQKTQARQEEKKTCLENCEKDCQKSQFRALQNGPAVGGVCKPTPPSKQAPPTVPSAPDPSSDPCGACNENGDMCCGSCPGNPLAAPCVGVFEGQPVVDCATALATSC